MQVKACSVSSPHLLQKPHGCCLAFFLVGYWARRIGALARLREQYTHKVTVAASVEGFRRQSPKYAEGMVAAAYEMLIVHAPDAKGASDTGIAGQIPDQPSSVFDRLLGRIKRRSDPPQAKRADANET